MGGDPAQHYLGWKFFRDAPLFQWPIGSNPDYGSAMGTSIVFSDSIPLLALPFKLLSPILPDDFQYFGLWIFLCVTLQGVFARKILKKLTEDDLFSTLGAILFMLAPIYLWRLHGHYALMGHWTILAGLYLYLCDNYRPKAWLILLLATVSIHAYLAAMVASIWMLSLFYHAIERRISLTGLVLHFVFTVLLTLITMWGLGYFSVGGGVSSGGFDVFGLNILSPVDSEELWSGVFEDQSQRPGNYEGFAFLGIGALALIAIAISGAIRQPPKTTRSTMLLTLAAAGLTLYSLSSAVTVGETVLFEYNVPALLTPITDTFRVSGRFFWPVVYLIYMTILYFLYKGGNRNSVLAVVGLASALQYLDLGNARQQFYSRYTQASFKTPFESTAWNDIGNMYDAVTVTPPEPMPAQWLSYSSFAAEHNMSVNVSYMARYDDSDISDERSRINAEMASGELSANSVYFFTDKKVWQASALMGLDNTLFVALDGFYLALPNASRCDCFDTLLNLQRTVDVYPAGYDIGNNLEIRSGSEDNRFLGWGWSAAGDEGVLTDSEDSFIGLRFNAIPTEDLRLIFEGTGIVPSYREGGGFRLYVNGRLLDTVAFNDGQLRELVFDIEKDLVSESGQMIIHLEHINPIRLSDKDPKSDPRLLSYRLKSMRVEQAEAD